MVALVTSYDLQCRPRTCSSITRPRLNLAFCMNRASPALAASPGESQGEQSRAPSLEQARPNSCVVADEIFDPPKRFVCSESFPPEATVAVRSAPSHQSEYLTCLPHGTVSWLQLSNGSMCTLSCFFRGKLVRLTIRRGDYVQWSLW